MSDRDPRPGDVWLHEETGEVVIVYEYTPAFRYSRDIIAESVFLIQQGEVKEGVRWSVTVSDLRKKARFLFNIFDLLSGDPCLTHLRDGNPVLVAAALLEDVIEALCEPAPYPARECPACETWANADDHKGDECPRCGGPLRDNLEDRWLCRACEGCSWETEEEARNCEDCRDARSTLVDRLMAVKTRRQE